MGEEELEDEGTLWNTRTIANLSKTHRTNSIYFIFVGVCQGKAEHICTSFSTTPLMSRDI
jgi:hypothetical protein